MVVWGFGISELLAAALRYRHLRFGLFCIKIILKGIQKSEITDCDTKLTWRLEVAATQTKPTSVGFKPLIFH
jgi:hypothetical protein